MNGAPLVRHRILAIYPFHRGFGFAVLESGSRLVDWGIARIAEKSGNAFPSRVETMIEKYKPTAVAVEDGENPRRGERAMREVDQVVGLAHLLNVQPILVSPGEIRRALSAADAATRHDIAVLLTEVFLELREQLPQKRRPWDSEDTRMKIFAAVGLAVAASLGDVPEVIEKPDE